MGFVAGSIAVSQLAFGSLDFLAGQVVGKLWMTPLAVTLLWTVRWRQRPLAVGPTKRRSADSRSAGENGLEM